MKLLIPRAMIISAKRTVNDAPRVDVNMWRPSCVKEIGLPKRSSWEKLSLQVGRRFLLIFIFNKFEIIICFSKKFIKSCSFNFFSNWRWEKRHIEVGALSPTWPLWLWMGQGTSFWAFMQQTSRKKTLHGSQYKVWTPSFHAQLISEPYIWP